MFDTMTLTKGVAAMCGTLLVFLLGGWAAELIYHGAGGHDEHEQAYVIEVEGGEDAAADMTELEIPFEEVFALADAGAGEGVYRACRACHALEAGANGTGPYLHNIVGRTVASAEGFEYSGALAAVVDVWTPEHLNGFLENPAEYAPGTKMSYNGLRSVEDRANLIAYLATITN